MAQDDVIEVSLVIRVEGEQTANVFHLEQTTSGTPTLLDLYDDVKALWESDAQPEWADRTGIEATLECIKVQRIVPTRDPANIYIVSVPGEVVSDCMPAINSVVHTWYSFETEAKGRGRKFWSGVPKSAASKNRIIAAQLLLEGDFAEKFQDPWVGTDTFQAGVYSSKFEEFNELGIVTPRVIIKNLRTRKPQLCI